MFARYATRFFSEIPNETSGLTIRAGVGLSCLCPRIKLAIPASHFYAGGARFESRPGAPTDLAEISRRVSESLLEDLK
jgi:hypothetical protein